MFVPRLLPCPCKSLKKFILYSRDTFMDNMVAPKMHATPTYQLNPLTICQTLEHSDLRRCQKYNMYILNILGMLLKCGCRINICLKQLSHKAFLPLCSGYFLTMYCSYHFILPSLSAITGEPSSTFPTYQRIESLQNKTIINKKCFGL